MDYITQKINQKSELCSFNGNYRDAATQEQSRLEYVLMIILGYLWNRNIENLGQEEKSYCYREICHPSIGSIVAISRKLDLNNEIFSNKKLKKFQTIINEYPSIRNEKIGHGFSFSDDSEELLKIFKELYQEMKSNGPSFISNDVDIINIIKVDVNTFKGITYKSNGVYSPCSISRREVTLDLNSIYLIDNGEYFKVSPFVMNSDTEDFYTYSYIEDKLAARAKFNQLVRTGRKYFNVDDLVDSGLDIDKDRKMASNGTIINIYTNNYNKYISTSIVNRLVKFLKKSESTVFSTVWGHGGVGKTAAIQRVCEVLLSESRKTFDYIVFLSAKDRKFNYYSGEIEGIDTSVNSYDAAIRYINKVIFGTENSNIENIVGFEGKMLLIFDDFETFSTEDKDKIVDFIKSLSILHHKVVITTRSANNITGEEIQVSELSPSESLEFFDSVLENELSLDASFYKTGKNIKEVESLIHSQTSGRPLFIYQCAIVYGRCNSISEMLEYDYNTNKSAINFLYGRILDYLSDDAKLLFGAMGLLVSDNDLSNLLSKLQYILNLEGDEDRFTKSLEELVKLKIITLVDFKYFSVYSQEIVKIMKGSFKENGSITSRLQLVGIDKNLDNNQSLLTDADNARVSRKPSQVINKYRSLISRLATPFDIKVKAIVNLAQYLIEDNGNFDAGIEVFREYQHLCHKESLFVKAYSTYLWRGDANEKNRAINLVKRLLDSDTVDDEGTNLDFLCILMRYETTALIDAREELKDAYRLDDIEKDEYERIFREQRQEFYRIYSHPGKEIVKVISNNKLSSLNHDMKIKVLNGLSYFIEICIRRKMFDEIDDVFSYIFNELKYNYHETFRKKVDRVNKSRDHGAKSYDDYIVRGSVGDRFEVHRRPTSGKVGTFGEVLSGALSLDENKL
ncbi:NB-ARC domain-containing protein [Vibrio cyclitrophicus]